MFTHSATSNTPCNILLVEDDVRLSALVQEYLQKQGLHVAIEHKGDKACERIINEQPHLVILDLMLPGMDGLEICKTVRPQYHGPILMLTARDEDIDKVVGLEIGADDYVTKPVQPRVLLAHIRALLRRFTPNNNHTNSPPHNNKNGDINFGRLRISPSAQEAWLNEQALSLTTNEFELLWFLANNAGEILSRDKILEELRGIDYDGLDRSVDIRISRLRKKLGDDTSQPFRIKTIRGKGYLFVQDAWN